MKNRAKLLIDDQPLQVLPALACAIGLKEATLLQQIHYLLNISRNEFDGKKWVYNTYEQWQEEHFPFLKTADVKAVILRLEKMGLLVSTTKFNRMKMDKTKWYTVNYDALENLEIPSLKINRSTDENALSNGRNSDAPSEEILPSNNHKITQEITTNTPVVPTGLSADADCLSGASPKKQNKSEKSQKSLGINYSAIAEVYNDCVERSDKDLPLVANPNNLSDKRKHAIKKLGSELKKRFGDCSPEVFHDYFTDFIQIARAFYFGENDRGWRANFEYLLRIDTLDKTLERTL